MMISASSCGSKKIEGGLLDEIGKSTTAAESAEPAATEAPAHEAAPAETTKKKQKKKAAVKENLNQLTGLYDVADSAKGKRPCAVMVNNIEASLPQYGIYKADIILEAVAEGGITRLMAVYADESDIPNVCSVRSARYYYMLFAQAFDAVYLHWGGDKLVCYPMMEELSIDHIDGMNNTDIFDRDYDRMEYMDYEHTGYLNGSQVMGEITALGIRQEIKDGYEKPFSFYDEFTKPSGDDCTQATLRFSDRYYSEFDYDKNSKTYKKLHNGSEHMDLAEELGKPLFLHERDASEDLMRLFEDRKDLCRRAVVHCFTGDWDTLRGYIAMGFMIGITGWICDDRRAEALRDAVAALPNDRFMIETDAPYLTPKNIPAWLRIWLII